MTKRLSTNGLKFIAAWEKFSPVPYYATATEKAAGKQTIGFGHVIKPGEKFTSLTEAEAYDLLRKDVAYAETAVHAGKVDRLSQSQYDALVDLCINVGTGAVASSTGTGQALRRGDTATLRAKLPLFINQAGKPLLGLKRRATGRLALWDGDDWKTAEAKGRSVSSL